MRVPVGMDQRNADIRDDDELLEELGPLTEEEIRELDSMVLVDEDESTEEGEAAPETARHEVPASDNERSAPDDSQDVTPEQGLGGPNMTAEGEEQRVRDPSVQEQDLAPDVEMSDAHDFQDEQRTQAGRESSKINTSSATARVIVDRPRRRNQCAWCAGWTDVSDLQTATCRASEHGIPHPDHGGARDIAIHRV